MTDLEKALVKKCKDGDVEAFEKLICDYQKKVFNLCYRYFENNDDASELAQEVFIKVYRAIRGFREDSSISTWIYKIAVTTCIDELRKRKDHYAVSIDGSEKEYGSHIELADNSGNPYNRFENKELKIQINKAIAKLPEEFKTAMILRDIQGFSYDEISKIAGIPLGTVKSRIKRARESVKEYLSSRGNFFEQFSSNEVKEG